MTSALPRTLGLHAIHGRFGEPWLPADAIVARVLPHPRLGLPLGPLAIGVHGLGDRPFSEVEFEGYGPGWRGGGDIDADIGREAWLQVDPERRLPDRPRLIRLEGDIPDGTEIAVVRRPGDMRPGIAVRRRGPCVLAAPDVTWLRVRGLCRLDFPGAAAVVPNIEFAGSSFQALGLPLGRIADDPAFPGYLGHDDREGAAFERVRRGAPRANPPHETPIPALGDAVQAAIAEERRVDALVAGWVRDTIKELASRPLRDRDVGTDFVDFIRNSPRATAGTVPTLQALLLAGGDPGVARWLGLGDILTPDDETGLIAITVAGRWVVAKDRWAAWAGAFGDPFGTGTFLAHAGLDEQLDPGLFPDPDLVVLDLWTQAFVDPEIAIEPTDAPTLGTGGPAQWSFDAGADAVRIPLAPAGLVPLAQLGVLRVDATGTVPLAPAIAGAADRLRPLLAAEGSSIADRYVDPPSDGAVYRAWQADMFGRWSDASDLPVAAPARPALPDPAPIWRLHPDDVVPADGSPFAPRVTVEVPIPARVPGQPRLVGVRVGLGSQPAVSPSITEPRVSVVLRGPALARGEERDVSLRVVFEADGALDDHESVTTIRLRDPRPPLPPDADPFLCFTDRPDAAGSAVFHLELPPTAGADGWLVYMTTESRLRRPIPPGMTPAVPLPSGIGPASTRDQLARGRRDQAAAMGRGLFDCLTPGPVEAARTLFPIVLPGDLAEVVYLRRVPVRAGASPAFESCPIVAVAVPFGIAPAAPHLSFVPDSLPRRVVVTSPAGRVPAVRYRLRLAGYGTLDTRGGLVIAEGDLVEGAAEVELPPLRPFAAAQVVAEVLARQEDGDRPPPALWSPPSLPLEIVEVPARAPQPIAAATGRIDGARTLFDLTVSGLPEHPRPGPFTIRLFRRDLPGRSPVLVADVPLGTELSDVVQAGAEYLVACVDPLGRAAPAVVVAMAPPVEPPPPVIEMLDPDNGSPGGTFTVRGSDLLLNPGDSVIVRLEIPTEPGAPPDPGPLAIVGAPTATAIEVTVPAMPSEGQFHVVVSRSDGQEAISDEGFSVTLL